MKHYYTSNPKKATSQQEKISTKPRHSFPIRISLELQVKKSQLATLKRWPSSCRTKRRLTNKAKHRNSHMDNLKRITAIHLTTVKLTSHYTVIALQVSQVKNLCSHISLVIVKKPQLGEHLKLLLSKAKMSRLSSHHSCVRCHKVQLNHKCLKLKTFKRNAKMKI